MTFIDDLAVSLEMTPAQVVLGFVLSFIAAGFNAWDARRRGRSAFGWGLAGLFFGAFGVVAWLLYRRFARPLPTAAGAPGTAVPVCAECRKPLSGDYAFCPSCGAERR